MNGLIELGAPARPVVRVVGVVAGVLTWALVVRVRWPGPDVVRLTAAVTVTIGILDRGVTDVGTRIDRQAARQ